MNRRTKDSAADVEERFAAWTLAHASSRPLAECHRAIEETGSCRGALDALAAGIPAAARRGADRSFRRASDRGYRILAVTERAYPLLLAQITDPPIALSLWGRLVEEDALALAVVGARRATPYGLRMSHRLGRDLAAAGLTVVSGLARGIDAAAHRGALETSTGRTLAVLGSGLGNLYPREHRRLAEAVAERGCVLSEFDLDEPPRPQNFPRRNRIITGLSLGTLVVEATLKSGSLVSARHALEQDREVFAVPGPVTSPTSEGVHALLRDGACLVTGVSDVLGELRPEIRDALELRRPKPGRPKTSESTSSLDPEAKRVLDRLAASDGALDVDRIMGVTGLSIDRALAALTRLELAGYVVGLAGGLYRSRI